MKTEACKKTTQSAFTSRWLTTGLTLFATCASGFTSSAFAHHSWGAIYNGGEPVSTSAVITGKAYRNPHNRVDATIVNEAGIAEEWIIEWRGRRGEGRGENGRGRGSATQYDLNAGDEVTIEGVIARDPTRQTIQITKLTRLSDGMTIEGSLGRNRNGEGRGEGRRNGDRENRQSQTIE